MECGQETKLTLEKKSKEILANLCGPEQIVL